MKKIKSTPIPAESLVNQYSPVDYSDAFEYEINDNVTITPDDVMVKFWTDFPQWVNMLFRIRNFFAKLVNLKGGSLSNPTELEECIRNGTKHGIASIPQKNETETILLLEDKHLNAYLSIYILPKKKIYAITLVRFKNRTGSIYFSLIKPFHKLVVKQMLKRAVT